VISSLFPHLPHRSRTPFRVGLAILFLALIALALLRWQAPLITISALGFPLVFVLYLHEADVQPERSLVLTAAIGIGLGIGWALLTGKAVADFYDVALGAGESEPQALLVGFAIPIGSAVLMLVPAVLVRLLRPAIREPLGGFVFGALGALAFTAAATLTRLAPQFATGLTASDRPASGLLVQAGIQGVAMPLTAAALGGLVGAALWFSRPRLLVSSVLVTLALYAGLGLMEVTPVLQHLHLGLHVLVAGLALLALRIGLQAARVAAPAASRHTTHTWLLTRLGAGIGIAAAAGVTAAVLATPVVPAFLCPPDCGRPPIAKPVESNPRFVAEGGEFSVQYPGPGTAYEATLSPDGVELNFIAGDTGTMELFGLAAADRTPKQIAEDLIGENYPDATTDYEIPNALVGYQPGYGVVLDEYPQDSSGTFTRLRLLVMVAVKNDYALVAAAIGPYHEFSPDFGTGHPSGVNLQLAIDMGKYVNSFRWRAEQPT
jgi:hypothetical protein